MDARCDEVEGHSETESVTTLVLKVSYDGSRFSGFAEQKGQPHVRTVASDISRALSTVLRRQIELTCAGRTDAGVHARSQFVSVPLSLEESLTLNSHRLMRSMAALLSEDVRVTGVYRAREGFSARFDAVERSYRYRLSTDPVEPLFTRKWVWWEAGMGDLDVDAMELAASHLLGEHDFKSFCKTASAVDKPTCRFVRSITFSNDDLFGERMLVMDIVGNAFLHSMVRTIMGTLTEVGWHRREPSWVLDVLEACDRRAAGPCAPASGLTFWDVAYPEGSLVQW